MDMILMRCVLIIALLSRASRSHDVYKQLDELDQNMNQELNENLCERPTLAYCKDDITHPVPKVQSKLHSYYDALVESAIDSLTLATKGSVLSCKTDLKRLMCKDSYPKCKGEKAYWGNGKQRCGKVIERCPQDVRDVLMQFDFCNKLNEGNKDVKTCVAQLRTDKMKYCITNSTTRVSPWNHHLAIEVNSLLEMQMSLWELSKQCENAMSKYLCFPAVSCWNGKEAAKMVLQYKQLCNETVALCSNDVMSSAMKRLFLTCY